MNDNEKLIEAIAAFDAAENALPDKPQAAYAVVNAARVALAMFEKAHTPTDDEREERAEAIVSRHLSRLAKQSPRWAEDDTAIGGQAANIVRQLAEAGLLRRSEVPEPSLCTSAYCIPRDNHHVSSCPNRPKPQGEPSDLSDEEVPEPSAGTNFPMGTKADLEARAHLFGKPEPASHSEPQGEPSDSQVRAAQEVLAKWRPMPESVVRDALRAAGDAR